MQSINMVALVFMDPKLKGKKKQKTMDTVERKERKDSRKHYTNEKGKKEEMWTSLRQCRIYILL